jgi:hypothetical protein
MAASDYSSSVNLRNEIRRIAASEVERIRPRYKYATVISIPSAGKCEVQFPGETGTVLVSMPYTAAVAAGQIVRVEGLHGDRYIADVSGNNSRQVFFAYDFKIV